MAEKREPKEGTRRKRQLTPRQARALQNRLAGMTCQAALIDAGYSESTAQKGAAGVFSRLGGVLAAEFDKQGLTTEVLAEQIIEGTQAEKDNGKPDHYARHNYHKLVVSVRGDQAPIKHDVGGHVTIQQVRKEQLRLEATLGSWLE